FDGTEHPLFSLNSKWVDTATIFMKYAAISGYREKVSPFASYGTVRDKAKKTIRTYFFNMSIFNAYLYNLYHAIQYQKLIKPGFEVEPNQVIWEVRDKLKYKYIDKITSGYREDWLRT